ncbi:MAG TPA: flavodoxin domain-containing protein [Candidatus Limnocylindrales bacterium]|nr:flavodoxin domain-containing protein [Candidatus Limnocylindrales bacterium]
MRALVIYESMFGNTRAVALAIAEGIAERVPVDALEVGDAPPAPAPDVDLLVVGGPTHGHGMSTDSSRADAARRAGSRLVSRGPGMREWIESLPPAAKPVTAAAFDTRIKGPEFLWGSAAKGATKLLTTAGFSVLPPKSFLVGGPMGDLFDRLDGEELDKARAWGRELAAAVAAAPVGATR